jgi:lipoprotein-anchoring transpeptidase ErfK/SrfK
MGINRLDRWDRESEIKRMISIWTQRSLRLSLRLVALVVACALIAPAQLDVREAAAASTLAEQLGLPEAMIPVDFGQTDLQVYVPETGHTVSGTMLDYWRANGAASVYGNPISEVFAAPNGLFSQAFERGIFQYNPDWSMTDNPTVRLMPTGRQHLTDRASTTRSDGRRTSSDRRLAAWTPGSEQEARANEVWNSGGRFSDSTGFSIAGEFGQWYDSHEGWFYLGAPISEPLRERGTTVQYFENSILVETGNGVQPAPLPIEHPERYGIDTTPVEQGWLPAFSEELFLADPNPYGVDASTIPGRKWIEVSISEQTLTAWQGDQIVLQTPVSTGVEPNHTETGAFHVRIKYEEKDMTGVTDGSGAVTAVGSEVQDGRGGSEYLVQDVPHVMFINYEAEALHGAYWHSNFGQRMSHGCINLPLDVAAFLYYWAPLGTAVTVHE